MADLTIQDATETGLNISFESAAAGGDKIGNDGRIILLVKNDDSSQHTATAAAQVSSVDDDNYGHLDKNDQSVAVPAGEIGEIGPFDPQAYNDSNGDVNISYDAVTSVSVAAIKLADLKR